MAEISDVIRSIVNEDAVGAKKAVSELLFDKVRTTLDEMRVEVAQSLFEDGPEPPIDTEENRSVGGEEIEDIEDMDSDQEYDESDEESDDEESDDEESDEEETESNE